MAKGVTTGYRSEYTRTMANGKPRERLEKHNQKLKAAAVSKNRDTNTKRIVAGSKSARAGGAAAVMQWDQRQKTKKENF